MQSAHNAEKFITAGKTDSFESLAKFTADKEQTRTAKEAAYARVIICSKTNPERELQNGKRQRNRQQNKTRLREKE